MTRIDRRRLMIAGVGLATLGGRASFAQATFDRSTTISRFGATKYPPDFARTDYVDPNARVGGTLQARPQFSNYNQALDTFNTLNGHVLRGDAPGLIDLTFASLMTGTLDDAGVVYPLLADEVARSPDRLTYVFALARDATFADGSPITSADVVASLGALKTKGHPQILVNLRDVTFEASGPHEVVVRFASTRKRDLPQFVAGLPIFARRDAEHPDFGGATTTPMTASGGFKVGRFEIGRYIEFDRVADWWGWTRPVMRHTWNFERVRTDYYRDSDVEFEAFRKGEIALRIENSARRWSTGYDFPAVRSGQVKRAEVPDRSARGAFGWWMNQRRKAFQDPRIREAIGLCFDFEWTNRNIFFGLYVRTPSYFDNSPLAATGVPNADEAALLEPHRASLPEAVFGEPVTPPVSDGTGRDRNLLGRAQRLLREAGVTMRGGAAHLPDGTRFEVEILDSEAAFQRVMTTFARNLEAIGIRARARVVDPTQYTARLRAFDFDILAQAFNFGQHPGEFLEQVFGGRDADTEGGVNYAGLKHPVVDALVARCMAADTEAELTTAGRALDRVLRALHVMVPGWSSESFRLAYWDQFDRPGKPPSFSPGAAETWWIDPERARRLRR